MIGLVAQLGRHAALRKAKGVATRVGQVGRGPRVERRRVGRVTGLAARALLE